MVCWRFRPRYRVRRAQVYLFAPICFERCDLVAELRPNQNKTCSDRHELTYLRVAQEAVGILHLDLELLLLREVKEANALATDTVI